MTTEQAEIYILVEASHSRGFGHLRRCMILANAFVKTGRKPVFLLNEREGQAFDILGSAGLSFQKSPERTPIEQIPDLVQAQKGNFFLDLVHKDNLKDKAPLLRTLRALRERNHRIAFLDGLYEESFRTQDMPTIDCVIQPYVGAEHDIPPPCDLWLCGAQYAILDRAYHTAAPNAVRTSAQNIIVTMGGADPQAITLTVMKAISGIIDRSITARVIVGPYFSQNLKESIYALAQSHPGKFELVQDAIDMLPHYQWADMAIGGSGTSRYEFAALGLPALFVAIYPYHERLSQVYDEAGLAHYLGFYEEVGTGEWRATIQSMLNDHALRTRISAAASDLIDSQGTDRLVTALNNKVFSKSTVGRP